MIVLGIETSCDETSVAVIDGEGRVLSNVIASQAPIHREDPDFQLRMVVDNVLDCAGQSELGNKGRATSRGAITCNLRSLLFPGCD